MASCLLFTLLFCSMFIGANTQCASQACSYTCPTGWTQHECYCYQFQGVERDWASAERFCIQLKGNLASIKNTATYTFLTNFIFSATGSHRVTWAGGNDAVKEGVWMWTDGSEYTFSGWNAGEPNNVNGGESCMEMNHGGPLKANDEKCTKTSPFVCQKKATMIIYA
ncbi:galactose-specific lectin nattectin-like [Melanotaenia boesemani]|uniref:galactose-specific lectin nattectin-like n=1 Tax=Melanotaenia boesemani TaxID=1250792 RepID=UPI001C055222|nr:galactose-specific lectin nattectin-like [Melanotaenia boesemani]